MSCASGKALRRAKAELRELNLLHHPLVRNIHLFE
jgi:hypothetical protein